MNRLHQKVIGVRPALVGPRRFANVHVPLGIANQPICKGEYRKYLVTILRNLPRLATSPKQFQRLAGRPQPSRPQKQHEKMEVGLEVDVLVVENEQEVFTAMMAVKEG